VKSLSAITAFSISLVHAVPYIQLSDSQFLLGQILLLLLSSVFAQIPIVRSINLVFIFKPFGIVLELEMAAKQSDKRE
jgi:hypothetical protein